MPKPSPYGHSSQHSFEHFQGPNPIETLARPAGCALPAAPPTHCPAPPRTSPRLATCPRHLLCLLQPTRPSPCSRGCATGRWGLAPAPCLWPKASPSKSAAAAEWAKLGAASVRDAPCLAQVSICPSLGSGHQGGASSKPVTICPHLDLTSSQKTLSLPSFLLNSSPQPGSLFPCCHNCLSPEGREGRAPGSLRNGASQLVL